MTIDENVQKLSYTGCLSILEDLPHVVMGSIFDCTDSKEDVTELMKEVIQCNLDSGQLDEIEILIVLSGE